MDKCCVSWTLVCSPKIGPPDMGVSPTWESLGTLSHGGTHEKAKHRQQGGAAAA